VIGIQNMHYAYPHNFWWLIAVTGVIALAFVALIRRQAALRKLGVESACRSGLVRSLFKTALRVCAVALLGVALLGPCFGERVIPTPPAHGRDLFVLLDVSRSMQAEDAFPSRLEFAKRSVKEIADQLERAGGFRIGLLAFAERPVLLCPLTTDLRHFRDELAGADLQSVRLREQGAAAGSGTELQLALERVLRILPAEKSESEKACSCLDVLLVSDGGDEANENLLGAAEALGKRRVAVYTLGIGDPARDSPIPVQLARGGRDLLRFQGELVRTRLQEEPLRQIAERSGGDYLAARMGPAPAEQLFSALAAKQTRMLEAATQATAPIHRFQWFLMPAVGLLLFENVVSARGKSVRKEADSPKRARWLARIVPPPRSPAAVDVEYVTRA
jgi:Ca-activated chloride channel homolog